MDEAKDYFLMHPELSCVDTALWGWTQGQTPATYTSHAQREEEPYKCFSKEYEKGLECPQSAMHHTLPDVTEVS